jgi:ATP-binding cassette subfamily F protein uup
MAPPLLTLQDITLTFGGAPLFDGVELSIMAQDRVCLVGLNGSGKSTLLKIAAGLIEPDRGRRFVKPGTSLQYLEQEPVLDGYDTLGGYAVSGFPDGQAGDSDVHRARTMAGTLGLDPNGSPSSLSGGERRRAALVRALAPEPDILLLDEPTNHLDLPAIVWLEQTLGRYGGAIVTISHDRRFLTELSRRCVWIDRGTTRGYDKSFAGFEAWRDEQLERERTRAHKLDRKIAREQHWIVYGVTARRKRNQRRLAELRKLRQTRSQLAGRIARANDKVTLTSRDAKASGKLVIEAAGIAKSFGQKNVVDDFSIDLHRRDRIGIVGPNGAGKTTLIGLLTGRLEPDAGTVRLGTNLQIASLDQGCAGLRPGDTIKDLLTGGGGDQVSLGTEKRHVVSYMKDFLFPPEYAGMTVDRLSGGERARLALALAFAKPSNLLVLDEPTNDLDLETLDLLQEFLADYDGTVLLATHDRDFLDRVVTAVIVAEGNGKWRHYAGGYSDMRTKIAAEAGAPTPKKTRNSPKEKSKPKSSRAKGKLSFKQQHALKTLPEDIARTEIEIAKLTTTLDDTGLFARDRQAFETAAEALSQAQARLKALEDDWLALEMLREELES